MKRNINSLLGFTIKGTDGEIGKVEEFYFDDRSSTIRYMVVKTGGWFSDKKVLISTESFEKVEWKSKSISLNLTQEKIKNSPDIDTDKPVSRQHEELMRGYYAWPSYYGYGMLGNREFGMWGYPEVEGIEEIHKIRATEHEKDNTHLRSTHEVTGYDIHATDGNIGIVDDFIIDDVTWQIDFLVVKTGNWFSGKKVLFSPSRIKDIDWKTGAVIINTTIAYVKSSPEYDPKQEITDAYILTHHDHYNTGLL